ncbi:hypothetical protein BGZ73_004134 [Actinomortierella ambigua]|nr:hypothetical protein BGZ73_004134 [Actinomortierella ambigua]
MAALSSGLVEFTGISSNDWGREVDNSLISVGGKCDYFPTIFQVVAALETKKQQQQQKQQQQGQPTSVPAIPDMAAFFDWEKFQDILRPKVYFQELFEVDRDNDQKLVDRATTYWRLHKPRLSFVYLGQVDNAGHGYGYGDAYTRELIEADRHIGQLLQALDEAGMLPRTTVAVVSDHGRMATGYGHGRTADLESNTHMFLWGPATIRRGYNISRAVSILDTSPTILAALGLGPGPSQWRGVPLHEALLPDSEAWHAASAAWRETEMGVSASWAYIEDQPDAEDPCRIRMEQGTLLPEKQMMERVLLYLVSHFDTNYVRGFLTGILLTLILGMCWGTLLCGRACVLKFMRGQDGWKPLPVIPNTNAVQTPDP